MLTVVHGYEVNLFSDIMEQVWRFRHAHFVERLGWKEIERSDGREIDQFDSPKAVHLVLTDDKKVVGYTRLLPTTEPHLLSEIYPHLLDGRPLTRKPCTYEFTRYCAAKGNIALFGPALLGNVLLAGVLEYCLSAGIKSLVLQANPRLLNILLAHGWNIVLMGQPHNINGQAVLAIEAEPTDAALASYRQQRGILSNLLDLDRKLLSPVNGKVLERLRLHFNHVSV